MARAGEGLPGTHTGCTPRAGLRLWEAYPAGALRAALLRRPFTGSGSRPFPGLGLGVPKLPMTPTRQSPTPASSPETTVVVVPREQFSVALRSLDSILRRTSVPHELVYIDGNSPPEVRAGLEQRAREHGFQLLRSERYLSPNHARNLALEYVTTPRVCFVDNDVIVEEGWLSALEGCARETGAALVGPLTFEGEPAEQLIHVAGGTCDLVGEAPNREMLSVQRHFGTHLEELDEPLERCATGLTEVHCFLTRRDVLDQIGPFDEGLLGTREHLDLCLAVDAAGGEIWFEPSSVVTFCVPRSLERMDVPYFLLRWSEGWVGSSLEHFTTKHGITPKYKQRRQIAAYRRSLIFAPYVDAVQRLLGARAGRVAHSVLHRCERVTNRLFVRADGRGELHPVQ